jgi:NAD(P)-dependent dehydrogenase (short-subunit alcohol dehydrogenase family)
MLHTLRDSGAENPAPNTPIPRLGQPQEIGHAVAFLSSEEASFAIGAAWAVDGGRGKCLRSVGQVKRRKADRMEFLIVTSCFN